MATGLEKVNFILIPKKGKVKKCSNYCTIVLISHASKVILKIDFNSMWTDNFQIYKLDLEKADELQITEKAREFQKNIYFSSLTKAFDSVDHNKMWKILRYGSTKPPYLSPEKPVRRARSNRTRHGTTDWFQIGNRVQKGCMLSPCLFNFYAEYIRQMPGWMNHKLESRLLGEILRTSDMQMIPL